MGKSAELQLSHMCEKPTQRRSVLVSRAKLHGRLGQESKAATACISGMVASETTSLGEVTPASVRRVVLFLLFLSSSSVESELSWDRRAFQ
ncbi:hypothetical protein CEXT_190731 [Caerostris extrusa]|uniref:Uncharacterized protein n=1 Tax=Caerostris extrusa TaxID=172846 RepID=A0AAV4VUQ5_CAEEX|nr:hypothetical protein CEXT_190731 [Caerostris extrusa]